MRARRAREDDRPGRAPVALRLVEGNLAFTSTAAWAWFAVPTQRWAFRASSQRVNLVVDTAARLAALSGYRLHLRVTSRPYPVAAWARALDERTPHPVEPVAETTTRSGGPAGPAPGVTDGSWEDHLVSTQRHLRTSTMADKQVFLGVRLVARPATAWLGDRLLRRPARFEVARLQRRLAQVTEAVAGPGLEARPATAREVEWLLRRSVALGLPAPAAVSPVDSPVWEAGDLAELADAVTWSAEPLAPTVTVAGRDTAGREVTRHVAVLTIGRMEPIEVPDAAREPWLAELDRLPFPVEWSMRLDVLEGGEALASVQRKLLVVRDMQRHYREHDLDEPLALERQAAHARAVEDQMSTGDEVSAARVHGWFRIAVAGSTPEQAAERARRVVEVYRKRRVTVAHPKGQYGLAREFIPGEPLSSTAYKRRLPVAYVAGGVPAASSAVGDRRGPYVGYTCGSSRRAVMFDTHYATEVRETSGLVPVVGALGSGKSVLAGQITYEAARRGITSVVLDPSGPMAGLCALPELAGAARHIDLTTAASGTLNPFVVVPDPERAHYPAGSAGDDAFTEARQLAAQDRKLLALDVATMLLPAQLAAMPRTRMLLTDAVRVTAGAPLCSLFTVVEALEHRDDEHAGDMAAYLRDMAQMPLARLFFPTGPVVPGGGPDAVLTVLTMPGLVLPPAGVAREHWSTSEQLAVPLLHLASWYASRTIYGRARGERKLVALDETHFLGQWGTGRALFTRLGRDSRKWNTCVLAASQNPSDVLGMEVSNFLSAAFVGRIEDEQVAADALRMLRVPPGCGYESVLARLSPKSAAQNRSGLREFVMRDVDGNVDKVRVDLDHLPHLLSALDTTAAPADSCDGRDPDPNRAADTAGVGGRNGVVRRGTAA